MIYLSSSCNITTSR